MCFARSRPRSGTPRTCHPSTRGPRTHDSGRLRFKKRLIELWPRQTKQDAAHRARCQSRGGQAQSVSLSLSRSLSLSLCLSLSQHVSMRRSRRSTHAGARQRFRKCVTATAKNGSLRSALLLSLAMLTSAWAHDHLRLLGHRACAGLESLQCAHCLIDMKMRLLRHVVNHRIGTSSYAGHRCFWCAEP